MFINLDSMITQLDDRGMREWLDGSAYGNGFFITTFCCL